MIVNNIFRKEADEIVESLTHITNLPGTTLAEPNETEPIRTVNLIAIRKADWCWPVGVGEIYKRLITELIEI